MGRLFSRTTLALAASKSVSRLSGWMRAGGGTSLPGKTARRIDPDLLRKLGAGMARPAIAVTGVNGKTTTCGLLAQFLREDGARVAHNELGANMIAGITAALAAQSDWDGTLKSDVAVLEIDEASLRHVAREVPIDRLVVTNLFRDQLDRYGELDMTARMIREGIAASRVPSGGPLFLNADDPLVCALGDAAERVSYFGTQTITYAHPVAIASDAPFPSEATPCPRCAAPVRYRERIYGHLGHFDCPSCGQFERPQPDIVAESVHVTPNGSEVTIFANGTRFSLHLPLPGLFNVYNLLAAVSVALEAGVAPEAIARGVANYQGVFGRAERKTIRGRDVRIFLIKNPVGATEVLRLVGGDPNGRLLIALNDNYADGRDVSWIWDAGFEALAAQTRPVIISGKRAADMAVRLKYAGVASERLRVEPDLRRAVGHAVADTSQQETLYVLPTYTALLALREIL